MEETFDEIYQFAADMGGAGFVFTGENDADIMHNSCSININVLEEQRKLNDTFNGVKKDWTECNRPKLDYVTKIFYSSSACMYPEHNQLDPDNPDWVYNYNLTLICIAHLYPAWRTLCLGRAGRAALRPRESAAAGRIRRGAGALEVGSPVQGARPAAGRAGGGGRGAGC